MKHSIILLLLCSGIFAGFISPGDAYSEPNHGTISTAPPHYLQNFRKPPKARAASILLKDLQSGTALYEYHASRRLPPASLTKILSALVILDSGHLDREVTISRAVARAPRTRLGMRSGDVFYLRDLLQAMLISSANDACRAATQFVGGGEQQFVAMMNERAAAMGLQDSHFMNACGFDKKGPLLDRPGFGSLNGTGHGTSDLSRDC